MKLQSLVSATLFAAIAALSLGVQAADVPTNQAATPAARHSHVQDKTGVPQTWPASTKPSASEIPANIANATTAADHTRIADYFAQKATSYDAEAALHETMARSYVGRAKVDLPAMTSHCHNLKDLFANAAKEARALEQAHRQLASNAGK